MVRPAPIGVELTEVMAGANGDARVQFLVVRQQSNGQNRWGPQAGEAHARAQLAFFDATGRETGRFTFPADPPTGGTRLTLIATSAFAALPGAPTPDVVIPPLVAPQSGMVCFRANPLHPVDTVEDCLAYGSYTGDLKGGGAPAEALPILDTVSLRRVASTGQHRDFQATVAPTPRNIAGATLVMAARSAVEQGRLLFSREVFGGNGRTCATCHLPALDFRLTPRSVAESFETVSTTYEPLFIAETVPSSFDAGFDFNLNRLEVTGTTPSPSPAPCTGELRGVITGSAGGRARVLTRVGPTTYLVYGGVTPPLSGSVTDGVCSATVDRVTAGDLGALAGSDTLGLEDPRFMRSQGVAALADEAGRSGIRGRGLILENIDGFINPPVFRKSPHLVNLRLTAPFGLSGEFDDLRSFSTGAVRQHFPRTLGRAADGAAPDFRLPTDAELAALEAFMLSLESPAGTDPARFDLDQFVRTDAQRRGRAAFFGQAKCGRCHGGPVLAATTVPVQGNPVGVNAAFNTGIVNRRFTPRFDGAEDNGAHTPETPPTAPNGLPCEPTVGPCGAREFSTPQLINIANLAPYFHDGSVATLRDAVRFYDTGAFNRSPAGRDIGGINMSRQTVDDITAFLRGLSVVTPMVRITDARIEEGHGATRRVRLRVRLDRAATLPVDVRWATEDGTATAGRDYQAAGGTVRFAPGERVHTVDVLVTGDRRPEADETVAVRLSAVTNAHLANDLALVTIADDDEPQPFTDETIVSGATPVRAVHFQELRRRIDVQLAFFGVRRFGWTHEIAPGQPLRALDVRELYLAVNEALTAAGQLPIDVPVIQAGVTIAQRAHVDALRTAVRRLEGL